MKEILNYPKCESVEDVQEFKEFLIDKMNIVLNTDDGLEIKLNRIFLFSKNLIVNQENQIVLNNGRFKLCINNKKELKIIEPKNEFSEISKEVYYMVR